MLARSKLPSARKQGSPRLGMASRHSWAYAGRQAWLPRLRPRTTRSYEPPMCGYANACALGRTSLPSYESRRVRPAPEGARRPLACVCERLELAGEFEPEQRVKRGHTRVSLANRLPDVLHLHARGRLCAIAQACAYDRVLLGWVARRTHNPDARELKLVALARSREVGVPNHGRACGRDRCLRLPSLRLHGSLCLCRKNLCDDLSDLLLCHVRVPPRTLSCACGTGDQSRGKNCLLTTQSEHISESVSNRRVVLSCAQGVPAPVPPYTTCAVCLCLCSRGLWKQG